MAKGGSGFNATGRAGSKSKLPKLDGTEKQVKWANEIRDSAINALQHMIQYARENAPANIRQNVIDTSKMYIDRLKSDGIHAGDFIELLKDKVRGKDMLKVANEVATVLMGRTYRGNTPGERKLLGQETEEDKKRRKR